MATSPSAWADRLVAAGCGVGYRPCVAIVRSQAPFPSELAVGSADAQSLPGDERRGRIGVVVVHGIGSQLPAETLLQAYTADRPRADKQYKGQRITVRGVLGGYRQDPTDAKLYLLYLTGGSTPSAWVQCAFPLADPSCRAQSTQRPSSSAARQARA